MGHQPFPGADDALRRAAALRGVQNVQDTSFVRLTPLPPRIDTDAHSPTLTQRVSFACGTELNGETNLQLLGPHQLHNCEAALAVLNAMAVGPACEIRLRRGGPPSWKLTADGIATGLASARLPGRFEVLAPKAGEPLIVVDGAHTPAASRALADTLSSLGWTHISRRPLVMVLAAAADKDLVGISLPLAALAPDHCIATRVNVAGGRVRSASVDDVVRAWRDSCTAAGQTGSTLECQPDMAAAMQRARAVAGRDGIVCVTGSLHAAFEASRIMQTTP